VTTRTLLFLVTEDWYFVSHRLPLAVAARRAGYRVVVATRVRDHGTTITDAGCELVSLQWQRSGDGLLGGLRALRDITQVYRRIRPTIVHHVALKPVVFGSIVARFTGVTRSVNAVAGLGYAFSTNTLRAQLTRPALVAALRWLMRPQSVRIIVQHQTDRAALLAARVASPDRIVVIRSAGVDTASFAATPEHAGLPVICLPARMLWNKGVKEFVDAAAQLRASNVPARFVLVGEPDDDNPATVPRRQLEAWNAEGVIEWWGRRDDMPVVFQDAHIVCLPTTYGEGIPKVLIEAAASARPIVATDVAGCRDVVRNGENGILVPPHDLDALVAAIRQLLSDPALRKSMGARGREIAEAEFSVDRVIRETLDVYASMLA
jgi:glycosyltransferase involved in cell wall biosynthesis